MSTAESSVAKSSELADSMHLNEMDHHTKLISQLQIHASKWRVIGTYLGFSQEELELIQCNPMLLTNNAPLSYFNAMLSKWYQWAPGDGRGSKDYATLGALKRAISEAGMGMTASGLTV